MKFDADVPVKDNTRAKRLERKRKEKEVKKEKNYDKKWR